jgi:hypothetical protein
MSNPVESTENKGDPKLLKFDPTKPAHLLAYYSIHYGGKQSSLRFKLEKPFTDVPSMMQHKVAQEHLKASFPTLDLSY